MADEKKKEFHYGGQAVIEGVMMRGRKDFAVAVRRSNGEIISTVESVDSILGRFKWLDRPFLRGTLALIDAMGLGIKALLYSANIAMQDAIEVEEKARAQKTKESSAESQTESNSEAISKASNDKKQSKVNDIAVGFTVVLGLLLGLGIFFLVPIIITKPLSNIIHVKWQLTAIEGAVKICIFILYILGISLLPDIRRIFQYHGAEHKTINAYEAGVPLNVENVINHTKAHVRCGTSFILVVLVVSIIVFMLVADHLPYGSLADKNFISYLMRWVYKIMLLPFVAGVAYEVIRFAGKRKESLLTKLLTAPGLLMQKVTTREPEPEMIEVAIKSLQEVLDKESTSEKTTVTSDKEALGES